MAQDHLPLKIPVFSVLRNGCVLKNIFLSGPEKELCRDYEDMPVLMGRHPDCQIVVDHPSISRFHLHIFAKPSIHKITILDRSSVHGTWVSGTKIEPNIPVDIKEGDILRLGASTREYRLQWLSLDEAYEIENPLPPLIEDKEENPLPPLIEDLIEDKEENHQVLETIQDYFKDFFTIFECYLSPLLLVLDTNLPGQASDKEEICQEEVLTNQNEITTHGVPKEQVPFKLEKAQQSPVKEDLTDTGLLSGPVLPASECTGILERAAASSLLSDLVGAHPISEQTLPYSESGGSIARETPARLLSKIVGTSMISEPVPPDSGSTGFILKATSSNLHQHLNTSSTSQLAQPASDSVKSVRKRTPLNLLSRRPKSKFVGSLSIQTGMTKEKAQLEEMSNDLFEKSSMKEVELDNEEIFESDKENMTPAKSCGTRNKASQKTLCTMGETKQHIKLGMNSSSKLVTKVSVRKGVKKSAETLCASGKSNQNGGSISLNSREILSEPKVIESCASTNEKVIPKLFVSRSIKKSRRTVRILGEKKLSDGFCSKVFHENGDSSASVKQNGNLHVSVRRSKKKSEETVQAGKSTAKILFDNCVENENFGSDKDDAILISSSNGSKYRPLSNNPGRALFQGDFEGVEDESCGIFASDKENCAPDSQLSQKLRKPLFDDPVAVDIEIGERKETDRVPFQVLFDNHFRVPHNSPLKPLSTIPDNSSKCWPQQQVQREKTRVPRKEWIMVVDIDCLLGEESMKSLRLLQGLRGTRLTIPMIVIRELDCMKRREGFFKRPNKQASLVLEWIEECMEREPLWIHVQSSAEKVLVAPTPPITPTSLYGDVGVDLGSGFRSDQNAIYSPCSSFMEILTPTSEDHVLECALQFKKMKGGYDAEVVILSGSTTLKIKAMAEGLLCEEAKDFRNSLTNPYSKRFMWFSSNPLGNTRSCSGEAAMTADNHNSKDKNPVFARRTFKATEAIRGLKLILLHNSHYAQTSLVS